MKRNPFILGAYILFVVLYGLGAYFFLSMHIENRATRQVLTEYGTEGIGKLTRLNNTGIGKTYTQDPGRWYIGNGGSQFTYTHGTLGPYKIRTPTSIKTRKYMEKNILGFPILYIEGVPNSAKIVNRQGKIITPPHNLYGLLLFVIMVGSCLMGFYYKRTGKSL